MNAVDPLLLGGILFLITTLFLLLVTLYDYITTRKFNKYGIITYGKIVGYEYEEYTRPYGDKVGTKFPDHLYVEFSLANQNYNADIHIALPYSRKKLKEKYAIGSKKKIKVLKNKKGIYRARLLKENKENVSYQKSIILAVITVLTLLISALFLSDYLSYKKDIIRIENMNNVNYNKSLNNPNIIKFATLNDETIESMNTKFGVQGELENPNISQASYVWKIREGMQIKGSISSDGKLRSVELEAQDDEFYDSNVEFATDIQTLNKKQKVTYEEVKAKCGGIDGSPTRISNGKATTYVWVNHEYKLIVTIGSNGYVTSLVLRLR